MASTLVKALSIMVCLVALVKGTKGLSCYPCEETVCPRGNLTEYECPFGVVKDICYCCDTCAKGPGEECRGWWGELGICGRNYTCMSNGIPVLSSFENGTCV